MDVVVNLIRDSQTNIYGIEVCQAEDESCCIKEYSNFHSEQKVEDFLHDQIEMKYQVVKINRFAI